MVLFLSNSHAQHLIFWGIPINGTITDFEKYLISKGFEKNYCMGGEYIINEIDNQRAYYKGSYNNYMCKVDVLTTPLSGNVYMCHISIFGQNRKVLEKTYYELIELMINDNNLMKNNYSYKYSSGYLNDYGKVSILLDQGFILMTFEDTQNSSLRKAESILGKSLVNIYRKNIIILFFMIKIQGINNYYIACFL